MAVVSSQLSFFRVQETKLPDVKKVMVRERKPLILEVSAIFGN